MIQSARPMPSLLTTRGLRVGHHGRPILPAIDLTIEPGQIWALIGRNGSGKSTLLKTLLGLLPRVGGGIERRPGLRVAYVPQRGEHDEAVPARVIDVVRAGLDRNFSFMTPFFALDRTGVPRALAATSTTELARRPFASLSEGQKQRVLVARALAGEPHVLLLDEPTSAMDPMNEEAIFSLLHELAHGRELALLVASHQMSFVPRFATHVILVDQEDGVVEIGDRAEVLACETCKRRYGHLWADSGHHGSHAHGDHAHGDHTHG